MEEAGDCYYGMKTIFRDGVSSSVTEYMFRLFKSLETLTVGVVDSIPGHVLNKTILCQSSGAFSGNLGVSDGGNCYCGSFFEG